MYYVEIETPGEYGGGISLLHDPYSDEVKLYAGIATLVLNAVSDFKFSLLPDHPLFESDKIKPYITLVRILDERGNVVFRGRVIDPTYRMTSDGTLAKEYIAESELAYLLDSGQRYGEYHNISPRNYLQMLIDVHNNTVAADDRVNKKFQLGIVDVTDPNNSLYRYTAYDSTLNNILDDLVQPLGGYLSITHQNGIRFLNYTTESGNTSDMSIELADNLRAIESQSYPSQAITRLVPLGAAIESVPIAIERLRVAGVIDDTHVEYWLGVYGDLPFLGQLLINLSKLPYLPNLAGGFTDVTTAITQLAAAGAISSPEYWNENFSAISGLSTLLIIAAGKLDTAAKATPYADAGTPRLTIESVNNGKDYIDDNLGLMTEFGVIEGYVTWDDVTAPENLLTKGKAWLKDQSIMGSVDISALDLSLIDEAYERFILGNYYRAKNELLGIDLDYQLIEQQIDVVDPVESTLTFGDRTVTLSSMRPLG